MRTSGDQLSPGAVDLAMPQSGNPLQISLAALNCSSVHGSQELCPFRKRNVRWPPNKRGAVKSTLGVTEREAQSSYR